ncbi:MAG: hypothetical protein ACRC1P_10915 [Cellulosilyticaceae bacterium]
MAIQLQFLGEDGNPISLEHPDNGGGLNIGTSRRGVANIKKFKIKNVGDITAKDLIITSEPLNLSTEVDEVEYQKQLKAVKWKTFSKYEDGTFVKSLNLGNVSPNGFVEGEKTMDVVFTSEDKCDMKDVWTAGTTEFRLGEMRFKKLDDTAKGQIAKRIRYSKGNSCRDLTISFKVEFNATTEGQESSKPFFGVPVRINSNNNDRGYMFIMHYDRNNGKFIVAIHTDAKGMVDNMNRDYGTKKFQIVVPTILDPKKEVTFKVYNNAQGQPTFEVLYDGKNLELMDAKVTSIRGNALSDKSDTAYKGKGQWFNDLSLYDGDFYLALSYMKFTTEEEEQFIYMKSYLDDTAENRTKYLSSAIVSYIED